MDGIDPKVIEVRDRDIARLEKKLEAVRNWAVEMDDRLQQSGRGKSTNPLHRHLNSLFRILNRK